MKRLIKSRKLKAKLRILVPVGVLLIGAAIVLYEVNHKTPTPITVQHTDATEQQPAPNTVITSPTPTPTTNVPGGSTGESDTSQASITAPSGNFVSNHGADSAHPVTSGTTELSTCTTTPGATCYIKFTNTQSGTTSELTVEQTPTAGTSKQPPGTVSWTWTPGQENLTSGDWTVEAIAALSGQTKTTTDPTNLTISP